MRRLVTVTMMAAALLFVAGCGDKEKPEAHAGHDHAAVTAEADAQDHTAHEQGMEADSGDRAAHEMAVQDTAITRYKCPMHPDFIRDEPGSCGICGMTLVPFTINPAEHRSKVPGLAVVKMDGGQSQRIGVRTAEAQRLTLTRRIRTVGRIAPDERSVTHIHTKVSGWITKLYVNYTGQQVRRGDPVLDIYSPDLVAAQQEYLVAYQTGRAQASQAPLLQVARQRLTLLDMTDEQVRRLEETGTPQTTLTIYAPHDGTIIEKFVSAGQQVSAAMTLYIIADLSNVWVLADAYEADLPLIKVGQQAKVTMPSATRGEMRGRITFVSPVVDVLTRTAPFRTEFANTSGALRPGAFVDVELEVPLGKRLVVPRESILDSGTRKIVFVEVAPGHYEPREVRLGVPSDGLIELLDGVSAGERVVTSATFLIDSESKLRAAVGEMVGHQH